MHQHPHGHEKQRDEDVAERQQLRHGLMPVIGLRDHESRQERAEGERRSRRRSAERGERAHENDRDQEQLPAPRLDDLAQGAGHDGAGQHEHASHDETGFDERPCHARALARTAGEIRQDEHHRHDAQVLEDQHARRQATVRRVDLAFVGESLEHDGSAG